MCVWLSFFCNCALAFLAKLGQCSTYKRPGSVPGSYRWEGCGDNLDYGESKLTNCYCSTYKRPGSVPGSYRWEGCGDNLDYGESKLTNCYCTALIWQDKLKHNYSNMRKHVFGANFANFRPKSILTHFYVLNLQFFTIFGQIWSIFKKLSEITHIPYKRVVGWVQYGNGKTRFWSKFLIFGQKHFSSILMY